MLGGRLPRPDPHRSRTWGDDAPQYGEVYIKPSRGGQGKGVAWAKRASAGTSSSKGGGGAGRAGPGGSAPRPAATGAGDAGPKGDPLPHLRSAGVRRAGAHAADGRRRVGGDRARRSPRRAAQEGDQHPRRREGRAPSMPPGRSRRRPGVIEAAVRPVEEARPRGREDRPAPRGNIGELGVDVAVDESTALADRSELADRPHLVSPGRDEREGPKRIGVRGLRPLPRRKRPARRPGRRIAWRRGERPWVPKDRPPAGNRRRLAADGARFPLAGTRLRPSGRRRGTFRHSRGAVSHRHGRLAQGSGRRWVRAGPGKWTKQRLPLPDAVYNRISRRRVEASVPGRRALWRLSRQGPAV